MGCDMAESKGNGAFSGFRKWVGALEARPGVYMIQSRSTQASYVGRADKSLKKRVSQVFRLLNAGKHGAVLLQEGWGRAPEDYILYVHYLPDSYWARADENWLMRLARAFEDFGGYCQRGDINCVSASIRETERKLMKSGCRKYELLPGMKFHERINPLLMNSFCSANDCLAKVKCLELDLAEGERAAQLEAWKHEALRFDLRLDR